MQSERSATIRGDRTVSRRWLGVILLVLVLGMGVLAVVSLLLRGEPPRKAAPINARLELAAGDVRVAVSGREDRVVSGVPLLAGSTLRTGPGARALVLLPDGARIFLRSDTVVALHDSEVVLDHGEYWLDAPAAERRALTHRTGSTELTASEAGLSFSSASGKVGLYVARGTATLSSPGGRVEVVAGTRATLEGNGAPAMSPVAFWDDWTGGMANFDSATLAPGAGSGTIYGVDAQAPSGSEARPLEIARQNVRAVVRQGMSETEVDQTFFNPSERAIEGWYWFSVPARASVTSFSVETDGQLVEGELIERKTAAAQYVEAKSSGHSPAILEWIDETTYRARIYPIAAGGTRRVVLRYLELRPTIDGKLEYVFPMGTGQPVRIGEFSLSVDLGDAGTKMKTATLADARVERGGRRVTLRRSGYTPRAPFQLEATLSSRPGALSVARYESGSESADYVFARYVPDLDWSKLPTPSGDVVVVVDTSAGGDEAERQLKNATAEAILRALSDRDHFALVSLDVRPEVLHPKQGLAPATDAEIAGALEALAGHTAGGATDLGALLGVPLERLHGKSQPAVVYVGDGVSTSGSLNGEKLLEQLRRSLRTSPARLFTLGVGADADQALLSELARAGGGTYGRVERLEQTTEQALDVAAALKTPTITELDVDLGAGLDEPYYSSEGTLSRGGEIVLLARTHHPIPDTAKIHFRVAGQLVEKQVPVRDDERIVSAFVPRLWAAEQVRRLLSTTTDPDSVRGRVVALGLEYGLMTPYTSILALESEQAYQELGIPRRQRAFGNVRLSALSPALEQGQGAPAIGFALQGAFGCESKEAAPAEAVESARMKTDESEARPLAAPAPMAPVASPASTTSVAQAPDGEQVGASTPPATAAAAPQPLEEPASLKPGASFERGDTTEPRAPGAKGGGGASRDRLTSAHPAPVIERKAEEGKARADRARQARPRRSEPSEPVLPALCSDAAARPLWHRVLLWKQRLKTASTPLELIERYDSARRACELGDWRAERTFLQLMQRLIRTEDTARLVLEHFAGRADVQRYLAKLILRRAVDARLIAAVQGSVFGTSPNWTELDLKLQAIADPRERLEQLRQALATAPDDPEGTVRLVRLLSECGEGEQALSLGRRLRDEGLVTPLIERQIGDVLARSGMAEESVRTYSEIVEFDARDLGSRRLLGDIYLGHGWYDAAYRQYATLTEAQPNDPLGWLRLAAAAAGSGRVDEALRLERRVSSAEGNPGPGDPRRWANLLSAARLTRLIDNAKSAPSAPGAANAASMERELRALQLFSGAGTLVLLTWEDLLSDLQLAARVGDEDVVLGQATDAAPMGLSAMLVSPEDAAAASWVVYRRSRGSEQPTQVELLWLSTDGKTFAVKRQRTEVAATEPLVVRM
jgi:Ca-activated chloride channel homolog